MKFTPGGVTIAGDDGVRFPSLGDTPPLTSQSAALAAALAAIGLLTVAYLGLGVTNPTIVGLSFLLAVLVVATWSVRWIAVAASLLAFCCFNFFFLPPVGTWRIADAENGVALFTLLATSLIASQLSVRAREHAREAAVIALERTRLRREAELKSALLASLSHDLKTPLTAVTLAATNLNASWLTVDQRREQAEIVQSELTRLNRMFQDIVDMARIETHAVATSPEWVQAEEIVDAAARQVEQALASHTLEVRQRSDELIRLDPRLTSAALAHVLENAAQYSPAGSTITVDTSLAADELHISVMDSGIGIAEADLERVFERFYRGDRAREERFGTGMGLAIARGLLAAENGRVWATNNSAAGATVTIAVPVTWRRPDAVDGETE